MDAQIAVIGGGISGLAAGARLKKSGLNPIVFEKESFIGGRMSSETVEGFTMEKAAYTFPEFHKNLTSLLRESGLGGSLTATPGTSSTFAGGKEYQIKIGSPTDFLKYRLLSLSEKKDMVKLFLYAQSLGKALDLNNPTTKTLELEKESAAEYLVKNYGEQILEHIAYPIFCEIFLGTPENNSKAAFLATIKNLTRFKIFSFAQGMGMLPEHLMKGLDVRLNAPVHEIRGTPGQGPYEVIVGGDNPEAIGFDGIIFAVPSPQVPDFFPSLPVELKHRLREIQYSPSIVTVLATDKTWPNASMINNLVRRDFRVVGTVVFDHHKGPTHVPHGKGLVTAILCEQASRALFDEPDHEIMDEVLKELDPLFTGLSNALTLSRVYRWKYGAVQLQPGALCKQDSLRKALEAQFDDVAFAGDGLYKSSLEVAFNTGIRAAEHIMSRLAL